MFAHMLYLVCDLHASQKNVAVLATACDWKRAWPDSPLDPPVFEAWLATMV